MKSVSIHVLVIAIWLVGCQHPTEVQVVDPAQPDPVQVTPVAVDTSTYQSILDSTAISPQDQTKYFGFMLVTSTQDDYGAGVFTRTVSNVLFTDPFRPLRIGGITFGYWGINIRPALASPLTINGYPMQMVPHMIRAVGMMRQFGWEYYWSMTGSARLDTEFTWRATTDSLSTIDVSIDGPKTLNVSAPKGGGVYSRDENLTLRWTAGEPVLIYLSSVDPITNDTRPLMMFKPLGTSGRAVISANVLKLLPAAHRYVLTFVLAHRKENPAVSYRASILAQAASVYNCHIEIR